jgi:hypothetical protein
MTNETPVMFEDKMKAIEKRKDILENAMSIIDAKFVTLRHDIMELIVTHHNEVLVSEIAEYFKSKGWLSPSDQRPFCMESALRESYESDDCKTLFLFHFKGFDHPLIGTMEGLDLFNEDCLVPGFRSNHETYDARDCDWFMPYNNHPECARLAAMGVKRYEQGGGE